MENELNIYPRETGYLDEHDMSQAINFYELKTQFADLGFQAPSLVDRLRETILSGDLQFNIRHREVYEHLTLDCWFDLQRPVAGGPLMLHSYNSALYQHGTMNMSNRTFDADVPKVTACQVLAKQIAQSLPEEKVSVWILKQSGVAAYLAEHNPQKIDFFK